jgi:carbohydrate-selective porin OprB
VLNSEDEYAPLVTVGISPLENLSLVGLVAPSSHSGKKDVWNNVQDQPFLAAQLTCSPNIGDRVGHYRVYGWDATYDHPDLTDAGTEKPGWGVGLSLDQEISEQAGVFARFAYNNKNVYPVEWFWSVGTSVKGLLPERDEDELGVGIAGLIGNSNLNKATADTGLLLSGDNEGTEYHLEAYYRIRISEYLSVTPDVQYVINPLGNSHNDDVFAAMLRAHLSF